MTIVRGQRALRFPTRFMLVAATNPCPCGFAGVGDRCRCGEADLRRHRRRLSGPLLDRMDLLVTVERPTEHELARRAGDVVGDGPRPRRATRASASSRAAARRPARAATARWTRGTVRRHVRLEDAAERALARAYEVGALSARGRDRVVRVARTIADLARPRARSRTPTADRAEPAPARAGRDDARGMSTRARATRCLRATWLLGRLAGHLELRRGARIDEVLALDDDELSGARRRSGAGASRASSTSLRPRRRARGRRAPASRACAAAIRRTRRDSRARRPAGGPARRRRARAAARARRGASRSRSSARGAASPYGLEVARSLGRGLALRRDHDGQRHGARGRLRRSRRRARRRRADARGAARRPADRPYPAGKRALHRRIVATGAAVSELPPGPGVRRWMFPARNRIIAALAAMTVVVEAGERSGALLTAGLARRLGRPVGAVPGRVTTPPGGRDQRAARRWRGLVRGPQDVLDTCSAPARARGAGERRRPALPRRARRAAAGGARAAGPDGGARRGARACGARTALAGLARARARRLGAAGGRTRHCIDALAGRCGVLAMRAVSSARSCRLVHHYRARLGTASRRRTCRVMQPTTLGAVNPPRPPPHPARPVDRRLGLRRRRRHPGRPEGVCRLRRARDDRDHRDHGPEHGRRHRGEADPARGDRRAGARGGRGHRRRRGQDRHARRPPRRSRRSRRPSTSCRTGTPVVVDPVMVAESGAGCSTEARGALVELLLPRATVVTPNVPEARALPGDMPGTADRTRPSSPARSTRSAPRSWSSPAGTARSRRRLLRRRRLVELPGARHPDGAAHGSGCTHSSALAARLAWATTAGGGARGRELASRAVATACARSAPAPARRHARHCGRPEPSPDPRPHRPPASALA